MATYSNYQQIIQDIYGRYNPDELADIHKLLDKHQGSEHILIESLFTKYNIGEDEQRGYYAANTYTIPEATSKTGNVAAAIIVIAILVTCITGYVIFGNQLPQESTITEYGSTVDTISAFKLQRKYESNEVSADNLYTNKPVVVKGIVGTIAKSDDGSFTYVTFTAGGSSNYPEVLIQCVLSAKGISQIGDIQSGMAIAIVGMNLGKKIVDMNGSNVKLHHLIMKECVIVSTDDNMMF